MTQATHINITHVFLDYELQTERRLVLKNGEPLKLSKKSFEILLALVSKPGHVLTKQELLDTAWPMQIVTDSAINKQIIRLRKDLKTTETVQPIIETVRGVGVRLVPTVTIKQITSTNNKIKMVPVFAVVVMALFLLVYYLNNNNSKKDPDSPPLFTTSVAFESINIALVPSKKTVDWLNVGGLNYLSEQLQKHNEIQTISPRSEWFNSEDTQSLAIKLSQTDNIDYVLMVNNLEVDKQYTTDLTLRNNQGIQAKETLFAVSISKLFEKIDSWIARQLKISAVIASGEVQNYKPTDFALESYLRGRDVGVHKSYEKAAQLFQTAINEDPGFFTAWLALADAESELGHYEKSLALLDTLLEREDFDVTLLNHLYTIKAKSLLFLNQSDEADKLLDKSITLSEQKDDISALIKALTVKVVLHSNTGNISQKTVDILIRQLKLLRENKPDPYLIALSSINLSAVYQNLGKLRLAIKHNKVGTEMYEKANNIQGVVMSSIVLARIYYGMGDTGKALLALEKVDPLYQQIDGIQVKIFYLQYKAENLTYHGLKREAILTIDELMELGLVHSNFKSKIIALTLLADLNILYHDYSSAKENVKQMLAITTGAPQGYPEVYDAVIMAYDMYVSALTEKPELARLRVNTYLKSHSDLKNSYDKELRLTEAIILNKEGFKTQAVKLHHQLVNDYMTVNMTQNALFVGYKILDIQWDNDRENYIKTMNYLSEVAVTKYPILKYKARYLASNKDYINAYAMMQDLKGKANQFWTVDDQLLLEEYQQQAK